MGTATKNKPWTYQLNQNLRLMGKLFPDGTEIVEVPGLSDTQNITFRVNDGFDFTVPRNGKIHTAIHRSAEVINK